MTRSSKTSSKKSRTAGKTKRKKDTNEILTYRNKYIVVDTNSNFLYIGKLDDISEHFLILRDADVHDCRESPSLNEKYLIDAKKYGVRCNRKLVHIRLEEVISMSLLDNVIEY